MSVLQVLNSGIEYQINSKINAFENVLLICSHKNMNQRIKCAKEAIIQHATPVESVKLNEQIKEKKLVHFINENRNYWILILPDYKKGQHHGKLDDSRYGFFRDHAAQVYQQIKSHAVKSLTIKWHAATDVDLTALITGLECASYTFLSKYKKEEPKPLHVNFHFIEKTGGQKLDKKTIESAVIEGRAVNLARHLVNLPPNDINPATIEKMVLSELKFPAGTVKIDVWHEKKILEEGMNLLHAVGKGSDHAARMIHIKYRPKIKSSKKPVAFVGKGITFDTGGLDIKPSSAMRLMKKDMGGAAGVLGVAYWAVNSNYSRSCDFYLALAENSVDSSSMRPGDVYKSRAGYFVEIDNTDAEGRLVLADVMDVAAKKSGADEPEYLIDFATLTGAIKVALGADMAGLFSNDDKLANEIEASGQAVSELNWRMPLVQKYFTSLNSNFADFKNSADGFGGAITAALFLEKFCAGKKWAHLDIYSWSDKPHGIYAAAGGNGQPVQSILHWLKSKK